MARNNLSADAAKTGKSRFYDLAIRPTASGDGSISFVRVGRLIRDEPGFGVADTLCATGEAVRFNDLNAALVLKALRGGDPDMWLVHEDCSGVKLFHRVSRVGPDRVELQGAQYRYEGSGGDFALYALTSGGEVRDQSERVNMVMGFVTNEQLYPAMQVLGQCVLARQG